MIWVCPVTVAVICSVADAPLASAPSVHVPAAYVPTDGLDDTRVTPAGSASATATPWAVSTPVLATVTVNTTLDPTAGVASVTVFVTARSASGTLTVAEAALFAATGSNVVAETLAVFASAVWVVT